MLRLNLLLIVFIITSCNLFTNTNKSDGKTIVWKKKNSPIEIGTCFVVQKDETLIIEPGVEIRFRGLDEPGDDIDSVSMLKNLNKNLKTNSDIITKADPLLGWILVEGKIIANGKPDNRITFCSYPLNNNFFYSGNIVCRPNSKAEFSFCNFSNLKITKTETTTSYYGSINFSNSAAEISDCIFDSLCSNIMVNDNTSLILYRNEFNNRVTGIRMDHSNIFIYNNLFNNRYIPISIRNGSSPTIINNTFIKVSHCFENYKSSPKIYNNIFYGIRDHLYLFTWGDTSNIDYNYFYYNKPLPLGYFKKHNAYNIDPLFIDALNGNYRLKENSPCINSGKNNIVNNPNFNMDYYGNSREVNELIDIGMSEYQNKKRRSK